MKVLGKVLIVGIVVFCCQIKAANITVPSMSRVDAVNALASASNGDTLVFPAGTDTYTSPVVVTKAVTLKFLEGRSTILNAAGSSGYVFRFDTGAGGAPIRVTGLTINGTKTSPGLYFSDNQKNIRVDHCSFVDVLRRGVFFWGYQVYGVVDHCTFINNEISIEADGNDNSSWQTTEGDNWGLGTTNGMYIEDCTFLHDNGNTFTSTAGAGPIIAYAGQGARIAFRHNQVTSTASDNVIFWDSHGNLKLLPQEARGTIYTVLENNIVNIATSYRHIGIRGGCLIMISNVITGPAGSDIVQLTEEEGWHTSFFNPLGTNWPGQDQVTNCWFAGNTYNGAALTLNRITNDIYSIHPSDLIFVQPGRDFFVTNSARNIPPFGKNNPGIPGGWWGYVPLTYPHPRVQIDTGSMTNPPAIISSLVANGRQGQAFNYQILVDNASGIFGATGLPAGLTVATNSGVISGVPQASGTFRSTISAANAYGSDSAELVITIDVPGPAIGVSPSQLTFPDTGIGQFSELQILVTNSAVGTLTGTASVGAPFSIVSGGSYALASGQVWPVRVRFSPTSAGTQGGTVTFTGGGGASVNVAASAFPVFGWTFSATAGMISPPFVASGGSVSQNLTTTGNPVNSGSGKAVYGFVITNAGNYIVSALVNAADTGSDSLYLNIDAEPADPAMIWDVPLTVGFEQRTGAWRGNGAPGVAEFSPKVFTLAAGVHKLIVRGREPGLQFQSFSIAPSSIATRPATPDGFQFSPAAGQ